MALAPADVERPLFAFPLHSSRARGPDSELIGLVTKVLAIAVEVVGLPVDGSEPDARSVVPFQLDVHTLEAVRDLLHFIPGLNHTRRLPMSEPHIRDRDLQLPYLYSSRTS